jgi:hypothetical protein
MLIEGCSDPFGAFRVGEERERQAPDRIDVENGECVRIDLFGECAMGRADHSRNDALRQRRS